MRKTVTVLLMIITGLIPLSVHASEYTAGEMDKKSAVVEVFCDASDLIEPTATPTPAPSPTARAKREGEDKDAPWWAKLIEKALSIKGSEKVIERTTERITERVSEKSSDSSRQTGSTQSSGVYYTPSASKETGASKTVATPANLARTAYETGKSSTAAKSGSTKIEVAPTPSSIPTPEIKKTGENDFDMDEMRRRMIEAQIRFIPNEYFHNGAKPIPEPVVKEVPEEEVLVDEEVEMAEYVGPVVDQGDAQIIEITEEKIPLYKTKAFKYGVIAAIALLALIVFLLIAAKTGFWYILSNRIHKKSRVVISGVLSDDDNPYMDIMTPQKADEYRLLQHEVNKAAKNKETIDDLFKKLKSSGFRTRLPYRTLMSATVYEDAGKVSLSDMEPSDTGIYDLLCENAGKKVKIRFFCEKACLDEMVTYELCAQRDQITEVAG